MTEDEKKARREKGDLTPGQAVIEVLKADRPMIELPGDGRLVSDFATDLGKAVSAQDIFVRSGMVYTLNADGTGLEQMTPDRFLTWVEQFIVGYRVKHATLGATTLQLKRTMPKAVADAVIASPQFQARLRPIKRFHAIRLPYIDRLGYLKVLPLGYEAETQTYTRMDSPGYAQSLSLEHSKRIVDELLAEFNFADSSRSKAVSIAAMATVFGRLLLPQGSLRPAFVNIANAPGAGKTLLVKCACVPVLGYAPTSCCPADEEEMRKLLLATTLEVRPVLLLDNVKGTLASESLEGFLTSQTWSGRILGSNRTFEGENECQVFVTGNGCTVSPDMRRRSLFSELFLKEERAEDRIFKERLETSVLLDRREEILSALFGLVKNWSDSIRPESSQSHSSFPEWANVIGAIVEQAGYGSPVARAEIEGAADTEGNDMRDLVAALTENGPIKSVDFEELTVLCKARGLFEDVIESLESNARGARSTLGRIFRSYDGRMVGNCRFELVGRGHRRRFQAERITQ